MVAIFQMPKSQQTWQGIYICVCVCVYAGCVCSMRGVCVVCVCGVCVVCGTCVCVMCVSVYVCVCAGMSGKNTLEKLVLKSTYFYLVRE